MGFGVWGSGSGIWGLKFRVLKFGVLDWGLRFEVQNFGFQVAGVRGFSFRFQGFEVPRKDLSDHVVDCVPRQLLRLDWYIWFRLVYMAQTSVYGSEISVYSSEISVCGSEISAYGFLD